MVGVESPAQLPLTFNLAQARSSASSIIISRPISCSNRNKNLNHEFYRFTLKPHYASIFTSVRRQNPNPAPFTAFVSNTSFDTPQQPPDSKPNLARWWLATVFALTLGTTGISVTIIFLGREFFNAIANKDQEQFTTQLLFYLAVFAGGIPVSTLLRFLRYLF
ncbi:unnamed protein product [Fraxinus pennsylvanica]|uniref:Uncharacterized protein n=1 Tax=Fraxinus pennsylvanica TaxID=56036 RepID=A0AAD1YUG5_9LAMI|nr:unnamed protein product [Fraxinus pennsylvanica]